MSGSAASPPGAEASNLGLLTWGERALRSYSPTWTDRMVLLLLESHLLELLLLLLHGLGKCMTWDKQSPDKFKLS